MRTKICLWLLGGTFLVFLVQHERPLPVSALEPANRIKVGGGAGTLPPGKFSQARVKRGMRDGRPAPDLSEPIRNTVTAGREEAAATEGLEQSASAIVDADLPAALNALLAATPDAPGAELRRILLRRWAVGDPLSAAAWASTLPNEPLRRESIVQVATVWADADLATALEWARKLPEDVSKQSALLGIGYESARSEPITALEIARELPPGPNRDDLMMHAASQWAAASPVKALEWAGRIPDLGLKEQVLARIATTWAEQEPREAAYLAAYSLATGGHQDRAVTAIVQRWAQQSPDAAAIWVEQFPPIPMREAVVQNLIAILANDKRTYAADWLHSLPSGALRDSGISAYASALAVSAPEEAAAWITLISNRTQQAQTHETLLRLWPSAPVQPEVIGNRP